MIGQRINPFLTLFEKAYPSEVVQVLVHLRDLERDAGAILAGQEELDFDRLSYPDFFRGPKSDVSIVEGHREDFDFTETEHDL